MQKAPRTARRGKVEGVAAFLIVAALTAAVTPSVVSSVRRAREQAVVDAIRHIQAALSDYYADTGSLSALADLAAFDSAPGAASVRHFISGDETPGWNGPYLEDPRIESVVGGRFSLEVLRSDQAIIHLGSRADIGERFEAVLATVDDALDGDRDPARGVVWGDADGIHIGINAFRD